MSDETVKVTVEDYSKPLSDFDIQMIHNGLELPNEASVMRMAREILKWRGFSNPDAV